MTRFNSLRHSGAPHGGEPGVHVAGAGKMDSGFFTWRSPGMTAVISAVALLFALPAFAQTPENPIPNSGGALIMPMGSVPDALAVGWKGERVCELLQENGLLRSFRCTFSPGVGHEIHRHAPHFGYVLTGGKMRITDETGTREVETKDGSSWKSDGVGWHEVLNIGDTTAVYIITEPKRPIN